MALHEKITLENSGFVQGMNECTSSVNKTQSSVNESTKSVNNLASTMHAASTKTTNYRKQFMDLQRQLQSMLINYRDLSKEDQQSDFGKNLKRNIDELTAKAANWKDSMGDVQQAIRNASSDTLNFDAAKEGLDVIKSSLESFVAFTGMADTESKKFKDTIATLTKIETSFAAAIKIVNIFQKNSAAYQAILALQAKLRANAEDQVTGAIVKQTIAQKAANIVANMNPYVLLATTLITVGVAIAHFTGLLDDNTDSLEDNTDAAEEAKKANEEFSNTVSSSFSSQMMTFKQLQAEWVKLSSKMEKTEFLKKYKSELDKLPQPIKDITDADNAFINNTTSYIRAMERRAKAAGFMAAAEKAYANAADKKLELDAATNTRVDAATRLAQARNEKYAATEAITGGKKYGNAETLRKANADKAYDEAYAVWKTAHDAEVALNKQYKALLDKANSIVKQGITTGGSDLKGTDTKEKQEKADKTNDELTKLKDATTKAWNKLTAYLEKGGSKDTETYKKLADAYANAKTKEDTKQKEYDALKLELVPKTYENHLAELDAQIVELQKVIKTQTDAQQDATANIQKLAQLQSQRDTLSKQYESSIDPYKTQQESSKALKDITTNALKQKTYTPKQDDSEFQIDYRSKNEKAYTQLMKVREELAEEISNNLELIQTINDGIVKIMNAENITAADKAAGLAALSDEMEKLKTKNDELQTSLNNTSAAILNLNIEQIRKDLGESTYESIKTLDGAFKGLQSTYQGLIDTFDSDDSTLSEKMFAISDAIFSVIETVTSVVEGFQALIMVINMLKTTKQAASAAIVASDSAEMAASAGKIAANTGEAITGATASGASLPFPANLAAIAAGVAAVIAAIGMITGFAEGGIVSGSTVGDMNYFRANGGEMVLTTAQQARLFSLLNGSNSMLYGMNQGGDVKFKIKGNDLEGVLKTTNTKNSKL